MTQKEALEAIVDFEQKHPVEEFLAGDIHFWPLLRLNAGFRLSYSSAQGSLKGSKKTVSFVEKAANKLIKHGFWLSQYLRDFSNSVRVVRPGADAIFLINNGNRYKLFNGKYFDIFCDPVISLLNEWNYKWVMWERFNRGLVRIPRYRTSAFIEPFVEIALYRTRKQYRNIRISGDLEWIKQYQDWLRSSGAEPLSTEQIILNNNILQVMAGVFSKWFQRIRPKVLFVTCWYTPLMTMAAILAANRLGIRTVDVQHGQQGLTHFAYTYWTRGPRDGYEIMPKYFWVWGEDEAENIRNTSHKVIDPSKVLAGGNAWLNGWRDKSSDLYSLFSSSIDQANELRAGAVKVILVTLQVEAAVEPLVKIIKSSPEHWRWWLRLRWNMFDKQKQLEQMLNETGKSNYEIEQASRLPLYALMQKADAHVTWWSTCAIEATAFGLRTILIHENGLDAFRKQVERGEMVFAENTDAVLKSLEQDNRLSSDMNDERYFAPPASTERALAILLNQDNQVSREHPV